MRKTLVALMVTGLMAVAVPAGAQQGMTTRVASPGNGATVSGTINVRGEASSATGVRSISIEIDGLDVASKSFNGIQQNGAVDYSWDTTHSTGSSQLAPNGIYTVRVVATGASGSGNSATSQVRVDNAPSAVSGVSATRQGRTVTVNWAANPEPDITGYQVERDSGGGFQQVGSSGGTSYTETVDYGSYSYRVVALRSSPSSSSGRASSPSSAVGITVASPPPATDNGGSGSGNGGGNSPRAVRGSTENGFVMTRSGKKIGISGLPSSSSVNIPGLAGLPSLPSQELAWGTYEKKLPYTFPKGTSPEVMAADNIAARSPDSIIPPDGLRWLAAGLLLVVAALMLQFVSRKVLPAPGAVEKATGSESLELAA